MADTIFRDLAPGTTFEFDRTGLPLASGLAMGPWEKTGVRTYRRVSDGLRCTVGSVHVRVQVVEDSVDRADYYYSKRLGF